MRALCDIIKKKATHWKSSTSEGNVRSLTVPESDHILTSPGLWSEHNGCYRVFIIHRPSANRVTTAWRTRGARRSSHMYSLNLSLNLPLPQEAFKICQICLHVKMFATICSFHFQGKYKQACFIVKWSIHGVEWGCRQKLKTYISCCLLQLQIRLRLLFNDIHTSSLQSLALTRTVHIFLSHHIYPPLSTTVDDVMVIVRKR